ncbi:MAG: polysaccharide deacetylase [Sandaracinaceae bacterium]
MSAPLAALSVDLDEIGCYAAIYGLAPLPRTRPARSTASPSRLRRLFPRLEVPMTFFAVGPTSTRRTAPRACAGLMEDEPKIWRLHSLSHLYDLTQRTRDVVRREIEGGADAIERATEGRAPVSFRPGLRSPTTSSRSSTTSASKYDRNVFPARPTGSRPPAIQWIRLRGRRSHSVVDDPRVLTAPASPYRVGRPYWRRGRGIAELPIGVSRGARLPYIGTTVALAGPVGARLLTRSIVGRPLVSLELHGIDLADAAQDGLGFLAPYQADLRRTALQKEAALRAAIGELRRTGHRFVTCAEAARALFDPAR